MASRIRSTRPIPLSSFRPRATPRKRVRAAATAMVAVATRREMVRDPALAVRRSDSSSGRPAPAGSGATGRRGAMRVRSRAGGASSSASAMRSQTPSGARSPLWASRAAVSRWPLTSARQRGQPARWASMTSRSSSSTASRAKAPRSSCDVEVGEVPAHDAPIPASTRTVRRRRRPERMRLFTVPSGSSSSSGHLPVGAAAEVGEFDGGPLPGREDRHGLPDLVGDGEVDDGVFDVVVGFGGGSGVALLPLAAGDLGAEDVDGTAVGLGQEERSERAPVRIELLGAVPEPEEDLLDDLLGQRAVDQEPAGEGEHRAGVPAVGLGEGLLAVAADRPPRGWRRWRRESRRGA